MTLLVAPSLWCEVYVYVCVVNPGQSDQNLQTNIRQCTQSNIPSHKCIL
jgi:hypothetical protein